MALGASGRREFVLIVSFSMQLGTVLTASVKWQSTDSECQLARY